MLDLNRRIIFNIWMKLKKEISLLLNIYQAVIVTGKIILKYVLPVFWILYPKHRFTTWKTTFAIFFMFGAPIKINPLLI